MTTALRPVLCHKVINQLCWNASTLSFHSVNTAAKVCERGAEFRIDLLPELSATMTRRLLGKMSWRAQSQIRNVWECLSTENSVCKAGLIICELVFRFALGICSLTETERHCFPDRVPVCVSQILEAFWSYRALLSLSYDFKKAHTCQTWSH